MLSITEAAQRLSIDRSTLVRAAQRGTLRAVASGGIWLVPVAEVERYRQENLGKAGRKPATATPTPPATHPTREARVRALTDVPDDHESHGAGDA